VNVLSRYFENVVQNENESAYLSKLQTFHGDITPTIAKSYKNHCCGKALYAQTGSSGCTKMATIQ
jgi:hypothetical protein